MTAGDGGPEDATYGGSCLCARVRYRATGPFLDMLHCHCSDCRKTHGAAFLTAIGVSRERLTIEADADAVTSYTADSGTRRTFCRACGSKIAVENPSWDAVYVPAATLDTPLPHRPQLHMFVRSKVAWFDILDGLPQFETGPEKDYRLRIPPLRR